MADKLELDIEVGGVEQSINSIKDLKNAIKDARNEQVKAGEQFGIGSKQYEEASKRVSQLKDKVDDLGDSTRSLQGSGIERASQGFNQLGEGLRNLDFDKVKVGLTAIKSALAATGIMLVVQGVMYLIENFDKLSKGSGFLAKALQFIGEVVGGLKDALYDLADSIGIVNKQLDEMSEAVTKLGETSKDVLGSQISEIDRLIAKTKASGESTVAYENLKQEAIIKTNKFVVEQMIAFVRAGGTLDEEQKKLLSASLENIKNAKNQQEVIEITAQKEKNDKLAAAQKEHNKKLKDDEVARFNEYMKTQQDELDALKARLAEERRLLEEQRIYELDVEDAKQQAANDKRLAEAELKAIQNQEDVDAQIALLETKRQIELDDLTVTSEQRALINEKYAQQEDKLREDKIAKDKEANRITTQNSLQAATQLTNSLQQLSDAYFYFKTKNLKKGSEEERRQAKKQFDINKGISIANATISGIQGVVNALSAQSVIPEPFGAILKGVTAVAVGAAAAANIAKIASTKFDDGGGSGGGGASAVASVPVPAPPSISTPNANVAGTKFDENGKKIEDTKQQPIQVNVKAQVVETEVTETQKNVSAIKDKSTF